MNPNADALWLGIDQGTHASRAIVFDARGRRRSAATVEVAISHPREGWAEQDPEVLVRSALMASERALDLLGPEAQRVAAAGLASQRASSVCWDRQTGAPLSPIFSWQDRRAIAQVRSLSAHSEEVHRKTGLFLSAHYGATKLRWALDHLPEVGRARDANRLAWGPAASFLIQRLTRERSFLAEPQTAARTQLLELSTLDWDPELLDLFALPHGHLPPCVGTRHGFGTLDVGNSEIPLAVVNGDQTCTLFSEGIPDPAVAYVNAGTGAFVQRTFDAPPPFAPRLLTGVILHEPHRTWFMQEGTVNGAASALTDRPVEEEWFRTVHNPPLFLNGVGGLGSPFWVPHFKSRFVGDGDHCARAVATVESIAFLLRANFEEMEKSAPPPRSIALSGGLSRLAGFARTLACVTGRPVHCRDDPEASARGAAFLAADLPRSWEASATYATYEPEEAPALLDRYHRWRELLAEETGI